MPLEDLTYRPRHARGGRVAFVIGGRRVVVRSRAEKFAVAGGPVKIAAGAARDRWGNRNGSAFSATSGR